MVCGAKCHFYGHCRILWYLWQLWHSWWYSWVAVHFEFISGDFHTISWFFSKIWMFWTEYDILVWGEADFMVVSMISVWIWILAWSFLFFGAFGSPGRCHAKSAGEKICRWEGAVPNHSKWEDAIATLPVKRFFKVGLVHHSPFGRRPWLQRYCWACVCNDIMVFHTSSRLVITL